MNGKRATLHPIYRDTCEYYIIHRFSKNKKKKKKLYINYSLEKCLMNGLFNEPILRTSLLRAILSCMFTRIMFKKDR